MKKIMAIMSLLSLLTIHGTAFAHPGRTDSSNCHTCKTNCAKWGLSIGEYHCHNAETKTAPSAKTTAKKSVKKEAKSITEKSVVEPATTTYSCSSDIYNCSDFENHEQAQNIFEECLIETGKDIHRLDGDNDGSACENL